MVQADHRSVSDHLPGATILTAGLLVLKDHALLGLGLMLSAGEVPRICGAFGLDTSTRANISVIAVAAQSAVNTTAPWYRQWGGNGMK